MKTWLWSGLMWGTGIGLAGMLLLLFNGDLPLIEAPLFVGVWMSLGLLVGFLMARNEEQNRLDSRAAVLRTANMAPAVVPNQRGGLSQHQHTGGLEPQTKRTAV